VIPFISIAVLIIHHQLSDNSQNQLINKRISSLSSDKPSFDSAVPLYEDALKQSNFNTTLRYDNETNSSKPKKRARSRNIIWYNPPYSKNVKTKVAENFLRLIDKHFPKSSILHKIFDRNSVKFSYSCMNNIKASISNHNRRVLKNQNHNRQLSREKRCV
jgi:16S rRNA G966 N2-methylase RsmD